MDKLIELLNEYAKVLGIWDYVWWHNKKTVENSYYIFTKKFWFIQWLIENDKIDLLKLTCMNPRYTPILDSDSSWEDRIIMILSIQDNPIEFLISILR